MTGGEITLALTHVVLPGGGDIPLGENHGPLLVLVEQGALSADSGDIVPLEPDPTQPGATDARELLWIPAKPMRP